MPVSEDKRKVAVIADDHHPQLIDLDQGVPLAAVLKNVCEVWNLTNSEEFCLYLSEPRKFFVTERNRGEIQDGYILKLSPTPAKTARSLMDQLTIGGLTEVLTGLRNLAQLSPDITFAQEFIHQDGLFLLGVRIENNDYAGEALGYALKAFVELMDHGISSWDSIEPKFIKTVSSSVNVTRNTMGDASTLQAALEILECLVLHSTGNYSRIEQEVTPVSLVQHLQCSNPIIQKSALALINALFHKADMSKRKKIADNLTSKSIRNVILNSVIGGQASNLSSDMVHELYTLQTLQFGLLEDRLGAVNTSDQIVIREITDIRKLAFENDPDPPMSSLRRQSYAKDYKKLGFRNHSNPADDFTVSPPGRLALDNMLYFAKNSQDEFTKLVLENSCRADDHDLPFAQASIELTNMLCDILKVGESPSDDGQVYYAMFFTHDRPFEEFFIHSIQLLNKTWKEMRATAADFDKVLGVVREQITGVLVDQPSTFEQFHTKVWRLDYTRITEQREMKRKEMEQWESQAKPIVELREQLQPEIMDLIKQQRLNFLVEGTRFSDRMGRNRDKSWYCRLSPNHKVLRYGDCAENMVPSLEQLPHKLAVVDIKGLVTGKDCPHAKKKKLTATQLPFSIITEAEMSESPLNFISPDKTTYDLWTDGVNALLTNPMTSDQTKQDLDMLLNMEVRLRLLDTEGIQIPENPPPIPPEPPNYDFAYKI